MAKKQPKLQSKGNSEIEILSLQEKKNNESSGIQKTTTNKFISVFNFVKTHLFKMIFGLLGIIISIFIFLSQQTPTIIIIAPLNENKISLTDLKNDTLKIIIYHRLFNPYLNNMIIFERDSIEINKYKQKINRILFLIPFSDIFNKNIYYSTGEHTKQILILSKTPLLGLMQHVSLILTLTGEKKINKKLSSLPIVKIQTYADLIEELFSDLFKKTEKFLKQSNFNEAMNLENVYILFSSNNEQESNHLKDEINTFFQKNRLCQIYVRPSFIEDVNIMNENIQDLINSKNIKFCMILQEISSTQNEYISPNLKLIKCSSDGKINRISIPNTNLNISFKNFPALFSKGTIIH